MTIGIIVNVDVDELVRAIEFLRKSYEK